MRFLESVAHVLQSQIALHFRSDYCRDKAITETLDVNAAPDCSDLTGGRYWTSVGEAMLTLFMSISGGIDWDDALVPLQTVSPIAVCAMLLYIVITVSWTMKSCVFKDMFLKSAEYIEGMLLYKMQLSTQLTQHWSTDRSPCSGKESILDNPTLKVLQCYVRLIPEVHERSLLLWITDRQVVLPMVCGKTVFRVCKWSFRYNRFPKVISWP